MTENELKLIRDRYYELRDINFYELRKQYILKLEEEKKRIDIELDVYQKQIENEMKELISILDQKAFERFSNNIKQGSDCLYNEYKIIK